MGWFNLNDEKSCLFGCCVIGLLCSTWNLFVDLYFMDFFTANMNADSPSTILEEQQSGYLFNFEQGNQWMVLFVQASGWMYPIWAVVTAIPLCIGFQGKEYDNTGASLQQQNRSTYDIISLRKCSAIVPLAFLIYGLCVVGGAFHSAFAFMTVLPNVLHYPQDNYYGWSDLIGNEQFSLFLAMSQIRILQLIFWGALPGLLAYFISSVWIAILVHFRPECHLFPKWFNLFNPVATQIWINILSSMLPDPVGFYISGCFGTWGLLFLNLGCTYCLWNVDLSRQKVSPSASLQQSSDKGRQEYKSFD